MLWLTVFSVFCVLGEVVGGGCGCGMRPPPMPMCPPPPMPICAPPPPPCPPPPLCPPTFCPPPPICPPPLPPPPPPMCPPPPPAPCSYQPPPMMIPYQPPPTYAPPPSNDCCCQCGSPCQYRGRARTHGARIFSALAAEFDQDPTCNNEKLRSVIVEVSFEPNLELPRQNIDKDPTISKRAIQAAAEEKLFAKINVICGKEDFSYVIYTDTYCQATLDDVTCYAFRPLAPVGVEESH